MKQINIEDMPNISDKARLIIANINEAFSEIDDMIAKQKILSNMMEQMSLRSISNQHIGVVNGNEYVVERKGEFWHTKRQWQAINKIRADKADADGSVVISIKVDKL